MKNTSRSPISPRARATAIAATSSCVTIGFTLLAAPGSARAESIPIVNPGFEEVEGTWLFNEFSFGAPPGWSLHDPAGIAGSGAGPTCYVGTLRPFEIDPAGSPGVFVYFPAGAPQGERVAIAFNVAGSGGQGEYGIVQTLAATLQPTSYTLTVLVGNIASGSALSGEFFDLDGFPGYRIELLAGGVVIGSDDNALAGSIPEGEFAPSIISVAIPRGHPGVGQPIGIRLVNLNIVDPLFPAADLEVDFDDVRLEAAPSSPGADLDGNGIVDGADLGLLLAAWNTPEADLDGDGTTDGADLGLLLAEWS
ncbi:MAG TPA: hypothetical protein PKC43_10170 [Phycisphaerales bacterium]|nr:hypothetical protein [Phycisphaerales bacterium]HMP37801.1 hypothetical protein [Phycisphaerales bacterium]